MAVIEFNQSRHGVFQEFLAWQSGSDLYNDFEFKGKGPKKAGFFGLNTHF